MRLGKLERFPARVGALKDRHGAAEDHLAGQNRKNRQDTAVRCAYSE